MRVRDVMSTEPVSVSPATSLRHLAKLLDARGISGVPVVDGSNVVGVVSKADIVGKEQESEAEHPRPLLRRMRRARPSPRTAGDAMSSPVVTVDGHTSLAGAAWLMTQHDVARLPVLERGRLVGIVTRSDLVRAFARSDEEIRREIVEEVLPTLAASPNDLTVEVHDGEVTLRGVVEDELDARCLPHAVRAVVGVVDVAAEISARHAHSIAPDPVS